MRLSAVDWAGLLSLDSEQEGGEGEVSSPDISEFADRESA